MGPGLRRGPFWAAGAVALTLATGGGAGAPSSPTGPRISGDRAIALAVNDLARTADGFRLRNPSLRASFTSAGVRVMPLLGGPDWRWRLTGVGARGVDVGSVAPTVQGRLTVEYRRGAIVELYRLKSSGVEQQFVLPRAPSTGVRDLAIEGAIASSGRFEPTANGWWWRNQHGAVTLGDVTVFDARGKRLPSQMRVTGQTTRIVVDGAALARAAYPVTVDPEIGANDFPISQFSAQVNRDATQAAVAYNPTSNEYLVVWRGDGLATDDELEIFGQRLNASTGAEVGANDFRISDMGPDGSTLFAAADPAVAYNNARNTFLVVWRGDDNTLPLVDDEFEIFGQRLDANGAQIGTNDFRISDMGPDGNPSFGAFSPAVAYKHSKIDFLVVWHGDDGTAPLVDGEFEIYAQRLSGNAGEIGTNDFRISDVGPDGNPNFDANRPAVAENPSSDEYLVVWDGDDDTPPLAVSESEIFGQRLSSTVTEVGANDFRISDMGPDGSTLFDAANVAVAVNATNNEYLVVWEADDGTPPLVDNELEIFGQLLTGAGVELGTNDFRISDMGPDGSMLFAASQPVVAYNATSGLYLVAWRGDDDTAPLVDNEFEIFGQHLNAAGSPVGANDFRVSDMGPNGSVVYEADQPAVAVDGLTEHTVVWQGDDNTFPLVDNAFEIYGQRYAPGAPTAARVVSFGAHRVRAGVLVRWRTASEIGIVGFNLWRGSTRLNSSLVAARASRGATYRFLDRSARPGRRGVYRLEVVLRDGGRVWAGVSLP